MKPTDDPMLTLPDIEVRRSGVHGLGAFATRDLPAGAELGLYAGRRYSEQEATEVDWDSSLTYLFSLSDGTLIDGAQGGNATRHLNHACAPNCEATELRLDDDSIELKIHTLVPVNAGDELFIDYALVVDDSELPSDFPCHCGSSACRGTLVAPG
jgi:SET domain-containing protein